MLCKYESCPLNAAFQHEGYVGYCTAPNIVTIDQNGQCAVLEKLLKWFNAE